MSYEQFMREWQTLEHLMVLGFISTRTRNTRLRELVERLDFED